MWCYHFDKKKCVCINVHNWQMHDSHLLGVCSVNRDHQQCSLSRVVNSGTTDLASGLRTNGLVKQNNFTKIPTTTLVQCMKIRNVIGLVIFTCQSFSLYSFLVNLLFISWFSFIFHFSKASFFTLFRGQTDGCLYAHRILWLLMVSIDQNDMSVKQSPTIDKRAGPNKLYFGWQN